MIAARACEARSGRVAPKAGTIAMKWHRRKIAALGETIETERFLLRPATRWRALNLYRRMNDDPEILLQAFATAKERPAGGG